MLKTVWREPAVWGLAVAGTIVWAGVYYLFAALISQWEQDLGWSKAELAVAFTICLLVSACATPFAGRLIDKGYGRVVLTGGALFGGLLLALMAFIEQRWQFIGIWALLGVANACCFYEPCFAYVTHTRGREAKGAITLITLVAGFAGTVAFPTANILTELYHWRIAVGFFATIIILIAVPLFWFSAREKAAAVEVSEPATSEISGDGKGALRLALGGKTFWLIAMAFALLMLNHSSLVTHFLPLLDERGISLQLAVLAASMFGPMQVLGRITMVLIERWVSVLVICGVSFACLIVSGIALIFAANNPLLIFMFVVFQGIGVGVSSIMRPLVVAELLGYRGFGAISGMASSIALIATAAAPTLAAAIWVFGGYDTVLLVMLVFAVLSTGIYFLAVVTRRSFPLS